MTGKTSLYCVTVIISCAANIEDASILFFCCVLSLFRLLSESFMLSLALERNLFFLGGEPDSLTLPSSLRVFSLHHCSIKSPVVYS